MANRIAKDVVVKHLSLQNLQKEAEETRVQRLHQLLLPRAQLLQASRALQSITEQLQVQFQRCRVLARMSDLATQ